MVGGCRRESGSGEGAGLTGRALGGPVNSACSFLIAATSTSAPYPGSRYHGVNVRAGCMNLIVDRKPTSVAKGSCQYCRPPSLQLPRVSFPRAKITQTSVPARSREVSRSSDPLARRTISKRGTGPSVVTINRRLSKPGCRTWTASARKCQHNATMSRRCGRLTNDTSNDRSEFMINHGYEF